MAKTDVNSALHAGGSGNSIGFRHNRLRSMLVIGEVALSVVLLSGAGLLIRSFYHLRSIDLGFDPHGVLTFSTDLPDANVRARSNKRPSTTARWNEFAFCRACPTRERAEHFRFLAVPSF